MDKPTSNAGYLNVLKRYVLTKAGIQSLSPGDCRVISLRIKETTGKVVSETTLKRFFGFAKKNYNFSAYTLNALCDYIGFMGWDSFRDSVTPELTEARSTSDIWLDFYNKSREVSRISLQSLRDHCGMPFPYTVSRSALETDFEIFMEEDYPCFALIGSPGMGKSIQIAHLAEKFFLKDDAPYKDSILWLFKKGALFDFIPHDIYLEETLYEQFGLRTEFNFVDYFKKHAEAVPGKVVLMMDGFDAYLRDPEKQDRIFQQFTDLLSYLRDVQWVKLVFSMHPATWDIIRNRLQSSAFFKDKWFPGVSYRSRIKSNVPPLLSCELEKVLRQAGLPARRQEDNLYRLLRYPVFLTAYLQHLERNEPPSDGIGDVLLFKLLSAYMRDKVHRANYDIEKWYIIKKILQISLAEGQYGNSIAESQLLGELFTESTYVVAYRELLQDGVLQRERSGKLAEDKDFCIRFLHDKLYAYLLFYILTDADRDVALDAFIEKMAARFEGNPQRPFLLKCLLWHLLEKRSEVLSLVFTLSGFSKDDKAALMVFVADYLQAHPHLFAEEDKNRFIHEAIHFITHHLFYLNTLDENFDQAVNFLLAGTTSSKDQANLLIIRAILALLRLDQQALGQSVAQIKKRRVGDNESIYPVHPLGMLEHLLQHRSAALHAKKIPDPLAAFLAQQDPVDRVDPIAVGDETLLSYQLTGLILQVCFARDPFLAFTAKIRTIHASLLEAEAFPELQGLLEIQELFVLDTKPDATVRRSMPLSDKRRNGPEDENREIASYFGVLQLLLKGDLEVQAGAMQAGEKYYKQVYECCRKHHYSLVQVMAALRLIRLYKRGRTFDHPVGLIKEVRQKTMHLALPIRELFLQKVMMEVG